MYINVLQKYFCAAMYVNAYLEIMREFSYLDWIISTRLYFKLIQQMSNLRFKGSIQEQHIFKCCATMMLANQIEQISYEHKMLYNDQKLAYILSKKQRRS